MDSARWRRHGSPRTEGIFDQSSKEKLMFNLSRLSTVALASLAFAGAAAAQQDLLFSRAQGADALADQRGRDLSYRALVDDRATGDLRLVDVYGDRLGTSTPSLSFDLGNGLEIRAYRTDVKVTDDNMVVWTGVIEDVGMSGTPFLAETLEFDPMNTVTIVKNGAKLTGNINFAGEQYQLRPLRSGGHALVQVEASQMPPDHPEEYAALPTIAMPNDVENSGDRAISTIRVMVHYTASAASASGDINALINLAVAETNTGYTNSGVEISLVLAHKSQVTYTQSGSFSTDLSRYRGTADGYMDAVHTTRNSTTADVGVLVINNSSSCGLASGIGSTAATAFAVVHWSCATGYYSFGHEIGHLQSARHDPAADPTNSPYAYGHGYQKNTAPRWRTIMAYDCSAGCTRLNYWSNPNKTYGGAAMGTTATHHNQRVLQNTKATLAAFR